MTMTDHHEPCELRVLTPDWFPWTHQVLEWRDGSAYGKPGKEIVKSMSNFKNAEAAQAYFEKVNRRQWAGRR